MADHGGTDISVFHRVVDNFQPGLALISNTNQAQPGYHIVAQVEPG